MHIVFHSVMGVLMGLLKKYSELLVNDLQQHTILKSK